MGRLSAVHGELAVSALDGTTLDRFATAAWGGCAPATWNRHVATLRSFTNHAQRRGWLVVDPAIVLELVTTKGEPLPSSSPNSGADAHESIAMSRKI